MSRLQSRQKPTTTAASKIPSRHGSTDSAIKMNAAPPRKLHATSNEYLTDRTTLLFVRRTLCPHVGEKGRSSTAPIDEILPPLTSRNDVDLQLYAFIAIIVREYIHTWYLKITPDPTFVDELVKIIAHCTRAVEQRLRKVDLESLLLDELPALVDAHVQAFRISHRPLHAPLLLVHNARDIYHSLWPFPALEPVPKNHGSIEAAQQLDNESVYRQLIVRGVLAILLPTEDLENDCLTGIVGQILSEIIGGAIGGKASEPWMLWEGITMLAETIKSQMPTSTVKVAEERVTATPMSDSGSRNETTNVQTAFVLIQNLILLALQYLFFAFMAIRFIITTLGTSPSLPSRLGPETKAINPIKNLPDDTASSQRQQQLSLKKPILTMKVWTCVANLLELDVRMPWVKATLSMLQWQALTGPGKIGQTDAIIDRILSHTIKTHVLAPTVLPTLLRAARAALFPYNMPGPPRPTPDVAECLIMRRHCAEVLLDLLPARVREIYFGPGWNQMVEEVEQGLDIVGDVYCNKHLIYGLVELVLVRLMPELAECGIEELIEQRFN
ncbi:hypothetical protein K3495_g7717 [Podosphaera aphanis]|nr:hypothetical protein K3495_g7717 [Podosphaera aphanis]